MNQEAINQVVNETVQEVLYEVPNQIQSQQNTVNIISIIVIILVIAIFIGVAILFFSPKARAKMMGKQIKAVKYTVDENEEAIHDIATKTANATKEGVETTVRAIRKGIKEDK